MRPHILFFSVGVIDKKSELEETFRQLIGMTSTDLLNEKDIVGAFNSAFQHYFKKAVEVSIPQK